MRRAGWLALLVPLLLAPSVRAQADAAPIPSPETASQPAAPQEAAPDAARNEGEAPPPSDAENAEAAPESYAETMVVTASRMEESLLDVPVSTSVIGEEQLATTPADNYADLLRGVPGLNIVQTSARDMNFVARGPASTLATSQLALVDGRSIYQDFFGFVMWDLLPVNFDEIEQVEILRGPGSAVWGANALAGVVNVRTKSPRDTPGGMLAVGGGEVGTKTAATRWSQALDKASYRVAASWYEQDPWPRNDTLPDGTLLPPEAAFANEGAQQPKLDLRMDWDSTEDRRWSYRAGFAGTSGIMHSGIGPFTIDPATRMAYGEVGYERPLMQAKIYCNWIDGDAINLLNTLPFAFKAKTWVADLGGARPLNARHLLVFGGTLRSNRFDLSLAPGEDTRNEAGVYVEDQAEIGKVVLGLGTRLDWFDTVGFTFSPRLSCVWKIRPRQSIRFAYNRAFRAPSLINNFLDTRVPNQAELSPGDPPYYFPTDARGNADLKTEIVDAFEIGWTAEVKNSTFTAAIYRNVTTDTIDFYPATYYDSVNLPPGWPLDPSQVPSRVLVERYTYRNIGKSRSQGVELSLNTTWRPWLHSVGSYTFQDENIAIEDDPVEPLNLNQAPRHMASFGAMFVGKQWKGSASLSYTGEAYWTDVLDQRFWGWTDAYVLVNGNLGWTREPFSVELSATNLLDEPVQQHVFGDVIGRKISATAKWKF